MYFRLHSGWAAVRSGVPEGSILGPILFVCFVADISHSIKSNCLLFADDVKLFNRIDCQQDCQQFQNDLDRLSAWSNTWKLNLTPQKCLVITLTLRTAPVGFKYFIEEEELARNEQIRDLGVILDTKLNFGPPRRRGNGQSEQNAGHFNVKLARPTDSLHVAAVTCSSKERPLLLRTTRIFDP